MAETGAALSVDESIASDVGAGRVTPRRRRARSLAAVGLALIIAAGCSDGGDSSTPSTTSTAGDTASVGTTTTVEAATNDTSTGDTSAGDSATGDNATGGPSGDAAADVDPVRAHCDADDLWLDTEIAAYDAWDAGDQAAADEMIRTDVAAAFATWKETLGPAGLAEDVGPGIAWVESWFSTAQEGGIAAYDAASTDVEEGSAEAVAFDKHFAWIGENC